MSGERLLHTSSSARTGTARVSVPSVLVLSWNSVVTGERLQSLRQARGWTCEDVGRATGIRPSSVRRIEAGRIVPDPARLLAFSSVFDVSVDFILKGGRKESATPEGGSVFRPEAIRELMEREGLSAARFAGRASVARTLIYAWLGGEASPRISTLGHLCRVFNVPIDFFFDQEPTESTERATA